MTNRISSLKPSYLPLIFRNHLPFQPNLTFALPFIRFLSNGNPKISPHVIRFLQDQVHTKTTQMCKAILENEISTLESPIYNEVIRRLDSKERNVVEQKMKDLSPIIQSQFIESIGSGDWDKILAISNYPLYALKSLKEGCISLQAFTSVMLPWSSPDSYKVPVAIFTSNGEVSPLARNLIEQTFLIDGIPQLSTTEIDLFFELLSQEPPIQKHFFLEQRKASELVRSNNFRNKVGEIFWGFNFLSKCSINGLQKYIIPSLSMMNCFLKVKFKENAMHINPVLGLSKPKDIEIGIKSNERDFAIHFPGVFLPTVDGQQRFEGFDFSYHDFFHAVIASYASSITRDRFTKSAQIASPSNYITNYKDKILLSHLYQRLIDMEFFFHYFELFMGENRPEWQRFLEEILIPISTSEAQDSLRLSILSEIFQRVLQNPEERRNVKKWIIEMEDRLGSYLSKGENELQLLDEEIKLLYEIQKELKLKFQQNPDGITDKLAIVNQQISTLQDKQHLYRQILDFIKNEYDLSVDNKHIFQKFLKTLPSHLN